MPDHFKIVPKGIKENLVFREKLLREASVDAGFAAALRAMCAEDLLFYTNAFCWTYDPRAESAGLPSVLPFVTYGFQDEAMLDIAECIRKGHDFAMPKSRDMGASWIGLTVFEWLWHFSQSRLSFLLISRNEDYVDVKGNPKSLFWKIDFLHEHQPKWLLPSGRWLGWKDPHRRLLHMQNADTGSVIDGESTTGEAGRGDRRTAMFIDEFAAFDVNDGFRVLKATRDTTNCRGFNSTPQGSANAFYEVVHNTAARILRLHWSLHPEKNLGLYKSDKDGVLELMDDFRGYVEVLRKGERDTERVLYPDDYPFKKDGKMRSPWYDTQCARCVSEMEIGQELDIDFLGSDYQFFDNEMIQLLRKKYCRVALLRGELEVDFESCEPKRFREDERGKLHLWVTLDGSGRFDKSRKFVLGADISAGTGASNSVVVAADRATGEKMMVYRDPHMRPNQFARFCVAVAKWMNRGMLNWDASGPTGEVFSKRVIESRYGNIYYRRNMKKVTQRISDEPGYFLSNQAKVSLLEDYRDSLGSMKYINRSHLGVKECLQFVRKLDGTVEHSQALNSQDPGGARSAHGDEVIADALCSLLVNDMTEEIIIDKEGVPVGSLAWRMEQKALLESNKDQDRLGEGW